MRLWGWCGSLKASVSLACWISLPGHLHQLPTGARFCSCLTSLSLPPLSSLSRILTRLVLVQYHLQFGVGVLFRHTVRNATALPWCDTSIIFAMLPSLAHKMLSWKFSYRKCWDGHYCGNVKITPKYYFYLSNCAVKADKLNNSDSKMSEAGLMSYWESIINK